MRFYNATYMGDERRRTASELVFLARGPLPLRAAAVVAAAVLAGAAGDALYRWEATLAARRGSGATLNGLQAFVAAGSGLRTFWVGWLAAIFFAIAALRVRSGPVEPSAGRKPVEALTPAQLRSGLRREYAAARVLLVIVIIIAAVDAARVGALFAGFPHAASIGWSLLEAAGFVAAALALALWAWWFGADLYRLGAM